MRFRKKPVEVDASRLDRDNADELVAWCCDNGGHAELVYGRTAIWLGVDIFTLEGTMTASPGDWIIRGTRGEFYPCKPEVFADVYEPAASEGTET